MLAIHIHTIPSELQRYITAGDYQDDPFDQTHITITNQENQDYEFLIAIHEMLEWYITRKRGIKEGDITKYDLQWEHREGPKADEPGNEEDCLYKKEHRFAENIERQVAHEIGVEWDEYSRKLRI